MKPIRRILLIVSVVVGIFVIMFGVLAISIVYHGLSYAQWLIYGKKEMMENDYKVYDYQDAFIQRITWVWTCLNPDKDK